MNSFKPALLLMSGRMASALTGFLIPLVIVRILEPDLFGTYKQIFLVYATLLGIAQFGMAESLYYFLPKDPRRAGRYLANSAVALVAVGMTLLIGLTVAAPAAAKAMNNPLLAGFLPQLGIYLALMLGSHVIEIAMITNGRYLLAAASYFVTDFARAVLFVAPVLLYRSLDAIMAGAILFAAIRAVCAAVWLLAAYGRQLRPEPRLLLTQLGYALPFAAAVLVHILQENFHQYAVSSTFDTATFAIYAVGCLQVPVVDFLATSASSIMMVRMAERITAGDTAGVIELWHDTTRKLALFFIPLAGIIMVSAREIILILFTAKFEASAPILMLWSLAFVSAALQVDGALRVYAATRFLLLMNISRLALIMLLIHPSLALLGLKGAVLVTLMASFSGKAMALLKIGRLTGAPMRMLLPWSHLGRISAAAGLSLLPALLVKSATDLSSWPDLIVSGSVYAITCATLLILFRVIDAPRGLADLPRPGEWTAWLQGAERTGTR